MNDNIPNNPVMIQGKFNSKNMMKNNNYDEEILKIIPMNNKKSESINKDSKNISAIEPPSQNDSKIGLLGKGKNLLIEMNTKNPVETNMLNAKKKLSNKDIQIIDKSPRKTGGIISKNKEEDSFSGKSSSMSSKKSNKINSQKIEKVKTFAEDFKYNNLKDEEKNSFNKITSKKSEMEKDIDDEDEYINDNNNKNNYDKKEFRRLTKREKIVKYFV